MTLEQIAAAAPFLGASVQLLATLFGFYYFSKRHALETIEITAEAGSVSATADLSNEQTESQRLSNYENLINLLMKRDTDLLELRSTQLEQELIIQRLQHEVSRIPDLERELEAERMLRLKAEEQLRMERENHQTEMQSVYRRINDLEERLKRSESPTLIPSEVTTSNGELSHGTTRD